MKAGDPFLISGHRLVFGDISAKYICVLLNDNPFAVVNA